MRKSLILNELDLTMKFEKVLWHPSGLVYYLVGIHYMLWTKIMNCASPESGFLEA